MKWCVLLCGLVLAGCSSPDLVETGAVGVVSPGSLPAPTRTDLAEGEREHIVGPFDKIAVEVYGIPDLSRTVQVDANGEFALPVAGRIDARGRTPGELSGIVEERLRAGYVRDPRVTIGIVETVSQFVTLAGEIETPGLYPVVGNMTLMRAIARAGGTSDFADATHVVVFRTVEGRPMAALYDLRAIRLAAYQDPDVYPNDVIVVGESQARRIFPQILQASGLLLTPVVALLNRN